MVVGYNSKGSVIHYYLFTIVDPGDVRGFFLPWRAGKERYEKNGDPYNMQANAGGCIYPGGYLPAPA